MSVQNRVFNVIKKQEKTELATQKVELANIKELNSVVSKYWNETDSSISMIKGLLSEARKIENKIQQALKVIPKIKSDLPKLEKQAEDLGINPNNITELGEAYNAIQDAKEMQKVLGTLSRFISTI